MHVGETPSAKTHPNSPLSRFPTFLDGATPPRYLEPISVEPIIVPQQHPIASRALGLPVRHEYRKRERHQDSASPWVLPASPRLRTKTEQTKTEQTKEWAK